MFDTPITTSDLSIDRVFSTGLPVALVFLDGPPSPEISGELKRIARETAGDVLVVQIQVRGNPKSVQKYKIKRTPAVVTIKNGQELSRAENVSDSDLQAHVLYLLGKGPKPPEVKVEPSISSTQQPAGKGADYGTGNRPLPVTDSSFDKEVLQSPLPVLVDFWAVWCGPCRMTEPIVEKFAREYQGKLKVVKVNVDENPALSQRYNILSIPTMMIVKNGQVIDRWIGALPEPAMRSRVTAKI